MTGTDWLDQLEQKAAAATPGPWEAADEHDDLNGTIAAWCVIQRDDEGAWAGDLAWIPQGASDRADAEFIAAANPHTVQRLINEYRALAARLAAVEAERDQWREMYQAQVHVAHVADTKVAGVEAVVTDWGCGTVHAPRSPYYARLRAALSDGSDQ